MLTAAMFGSYHLGQGIPAAISITVAGAIYGISFCLLRRLWPLWLAHALHNLLIAL